QGAPRGARAVSRARARLHARGAARGGAEAGLARRGDPAYGRRSALGRQLRAPAQGPTLVMVHGPPPPGRRPQQLSALATTLARRSPGSVGTRLARRCGPASRRPEGWALIRLFHQRCRRTDPACEPRASSLLSSSGHGRGLHMKQRVHFRARARDVLWMVMAPALLVAGCGSDVAPDGFVGTVADTAREPVANATVYAIPASLVAWTPV